MNTTTADPYVTLGVSRDAEQDAITDAYRSLMRKHHPDMSGGDEAKAATISAAYELLSDEGRRAGYDLDSRRGPVTTDSTTRTRTAPVTHPEPGPISFRTLRWREWFLMVLALAGVVVSLLVNATIIPVSLVAFGVFFVGIYAARGWVGRRYITVLLPVVVMLASVDPVGRWLGTGTWPLVGLAVLAALVTVGSVLVSARRMAKLVGVTQEKRWIFTSGTSAHDFLLSAGNATGWIGLTGDGPFGTMLMNGKNIILLATAASTFPGETLSVELGRLMRTRPGSNMSLPDPAVDLPIGMPTVPEGFKGRAAVFVPGVPAGTGQLGDLPVIGEADLLAWMDATDTSALDRRDVLRVVDLVRNQVAQV
ncbi:J domain-containing protein [Ornithinimicrobium murale]|uniref:J domain-containing protein n=1 Tax=Ornithinimicrobium murale TaxID=1050153 RepID=UPI00192D26CD|nr:J domain-containing protein [Ornithinimicrobium murale]